MTSTKAACRPLVGVYKVEKRGDGVECVLSSQTSLPDVFRAPIRNDLVNFVHDQISKNRRQPYAVSRLAGVQCSAASWGTGRAVARIPRVRGSGTGRSSQGAYGNMCRGGHMFNPTTVWRRWHRRVNRTQRRHAVVSALAASALPSLVFARGHQISKVPELPLVVDPGTDLCKTKSALSFLKAFGLEDDLKRCKDSRKIRPGKGKMRNRRYLTRRGPLVIHTQAADSGFVKALRNIPGLDLINVDRLNLLSLAPGGHLGRLVVWTKEAVDRLTQIYPNQNEFSTLKKGYALPHSMLAMPDIGRIINSDEVQKVLRPKMAKRTPAKRKRNPLRHPDVRKRLNPLVGLKKPGKAVAPVKATA